MDDESHPISECQLRSHERPARPRSKPFQYSIAAMLAVVAAYAVLFGLLRWMHLQSVSAFVAITLYLTALAVGQWLLFGGRHPYRASAIVGTLLGAPGSAAAGLVIGGPFVGFVVTLLFLGLSALAGVGLGGIVDIALFIIERLAGANRRLFNSAEIPRSLRVRLAATDTARARLLRLGSLTLLAILFYIAVFMIDIERQWRYVGPTSSASIALPP